MRPVVCSAQVASGFQLRFCTHKKCKSQGSQQVLQFSRDLAIPGIEVIPCGCLGACGSGPNVAIIPRDGTAPLVLRHVATPQRAADMLREVLGAEVDEALLKATELRLAGNAAARAGDLRRASSLYSEGLALDPPGGRHLLLSNRSGVRLELGDAEGALEDAAAAAACAPQGFTTAAIRQVEALLRLQRFREAMECLLAAREQHPGFADTDDYKRCVADVQAALAAVDVQA